MAIERLAVLALSSAFAVSLILYPDLPPDIPPRAGRYGPFIGAPFVAFFLPTAAVAMWWIQAALSRGRGVVSRPAARAGAFLALTIGTFHVTMLAAYIGGHPWLARVLGAVVGVFLIVTGNDLPRARPTLAWGQVEASAGDPQPSARSWQRVRAFTRVGVGLALAVTALVGMPWFGGLVLVAAWAEIVGRAASLWTRRTARVVVTIAFGSCCSIGGSAHAQGIDHARIESLPTLVDTIVPPLMEKAHAPGTALAIVYGGQVVVLRGFGYADLEAKALVEPSRTRFRVGSVSKPLTAIAALQLAAAGRLDLHQDVRRYVPELRLRFGATMHQLLTHTAGLDERFAGAYTDAREQLEPLSTHLNRRPPEQFRRPGTAYSYSNYNYAVAGAVIERVSGMPYERYMAEHVFDPLAMDGTTAYQPPLESSDQEVAHSYEWRDEKYVARPFRYTYASPAGGVSTTAAGMARLMLALLGNGVVDGARILSPEGTRDMLATQYSVDGRIPGTTYGMTEWRTHGQRLLHKDGTLGDQLGVMVLAPESGLGIFAASNTLPGVGNQLLEPVLTHLFGPEPASLPPRPMADSASHARRLAGIYRDLLRTRNDLSKAFALVRQSPVVVDPDGAIQWQGRRWVEVAPLVFTSVDGRDSLVFREDDAGNVTTLHSWGATFERIEWTEQRFFHAALLLICLAAFVAYLLSTLYARLRRRPPVGDGLLGHYCAVAVALANVAFVGWLATSLRGLGASVPLDASALVWLTVPLASAAITTLLPGFAILSWWARWWTLRHRLGYATFAMLSVAFMTLLNYWKLLGVRY